MIYALSDLTIIKKPQPIDAEGIGVLVWCWALLMVIMWKDDLLIIYYKRMLLKKLIVK